MEAICKRCCPYGDDPTFPYQRFYKGVTYNYEKKYHEENILYNFINGLGKPELFEIDDFDFYFITKSQIRKEKLEKIKNNYK